MRAGRLRLPTKRRLIVALALLAAALVPLAALGAASDWWFVQDHGPAPVSAPNVVKEGEWSEHPWQLTAYPSGTDLCFSVTPAGSNADGSGGATNCAPFAGRPDPETKGSSKMTITFLSGAAGTELPAGATACNHPNTPARVGTHKERSFINKLAGLDSDGNVVACLTPRMAGDGASPLSDCQ